MLKHYTTILIIAALSASTLSALTEAELRDLWLAQDFAALESAAGVMTKADAEAEQARGWRLRSQLALQKGESKDGVKWAERAVKLAPEDPTMHVFLGSAYLLRIDDVSMFGKMSLSGKMRKSFEQALAIDPDSVPALQALAGFYENAPGVAGGDPEKAVVLRERLWDVAPVEAAVMTATGAFGEGDYAAAKTALARGLAAAPGDPRLTYQLGKHAALTGEGLAEGKAHLLAYLELPEAGGDDVPGPDGALWRLGQIEAHLGNYPAAEAAFMKALALNPAMENLIRPDLEKLPQ